MRNGCKKMVKSRQGSTQARLDSFFTVTSSLSSKRKVLGHFKITNDYFPHVFESWDSSDICDGDICFTQQEPEVKGSAKKKQKTGATPGKFRKGK